MLYDFSVFGNEVPVSSRTCDGNGVWDTQLCKLLFCMCACVYVCVYV